MSEVCGAIDTKSGAVCTSKAVGHVMHEDASDPGCIIRFPNEDAVRLQHEGICEMLGIDPNAEDVQQQLIQHYAHAWAAGVAG